MKAIKFMLSGMVVSLHLILAAGLMHVETGFAADKGREQRSAASGLDAAVARVQQQTGGRVLRAQQQGSYYVIKVLMPSGVVKTYRIKAQ